MRPQDKTLALLHVLEGHGLSVRQRQPVGLFVSSIIGYMIHSTVLTISTMIIRFVIDELNQQRYSS